ncbi:MAG TPA: alpha-ketoglutarate-dependent dioxygenase AlkB [Flavobacteriales bacterium]|nr:alpha-ketoglutarate-dependent dioxygenase AlkB [Flavobacteriales bacterium]
MTGITYIENFIENPDELYAHLVMVVSWDERMAARKTASYGKAYNYSQIQYPYRDFFPALSAIIEKLSPVIGFKVNNCLINYYMDGKSTMGYHSDRTDILEPGTGIAIVSLGETRTLRFRNIANKETFVNYTLAGGSLVYMTQEIQHTWQHAIPETNTQNGRISLTFRKMV